MAYRGRWNVWFLGLLAGHSDDDERTKCFSWETLVLHISKRSVNAERIWAYFGNIRLLWQLRLRQWWKQSLTMTVAWLQGLEKRLNFGWGKTTDDVLRSALKNRGNTALRISGIDHLGPVHYGKSKGFRFRFSAETSPLCISGLIQSLRGEGKRDRFVNGLGRTVMQIQSRKPQMYLV